MTATKDPSNSNFFAAPSTFDWQGYLTHRPTYSREFYDLIYKYHASKDSKFGLAHDIGAGPGNVADVLAERFSQVVVSDASSEHVSVAKHRLEGKFEPGKFDFAVSRGEDVGGKYQPGSVDLVTVAECIPIMDSPAAVASFARLLKPGGTLAIWFYGRPIFAEDGMDRASELYAKIAGAAFSTFKPFDGTLLAHSWKVIGSWLDCVALPNTDWESVERTKWNADKPLLFTPESELDHPLDYPSAVTEEEKVVEKIDRNWWAKEGGVDFVRGFIGVNLPWKKDYETPETDKLYTALEKELGGKDAKHKITWPVVLILATRK